MASVHSPHFGVSLSVSILVATLQCQLRDLVVRTTAAPLPRSPGGGR